MTATSLPSEAPSPILPPECLQSTVKLQPPCSKSIAAPAGLAQFPFLVACRLRPAVIRRFTLACLERRVLLLSTSQVSRFSTRLPHACRPRWYRRRTSCLGVGREVAIVILSHPGLRLIASPPSRSVSSPPSSPAIAHICDIPAAAPLCDLPPGLLLSANPTPARPGFPAFLPSGIQLSSCQRLSINRVAARFRHTPDRPPSQHWHA